MVKILKMHPTVLSSTGQPVPPWVWARPVGNGHPRVPARALAGLVEDGPEPWWTTGQSCGLGPSVTGYRRESLRLGPAAAAYLLPLVAAVSQRLQSWLVTAVQPRRRCHFVS